MESLSTFEIVMLNIGVLVILGVMIWGVAKCRKRMQQGDFDDETNPVQESNEEV